MEKEINIDCLKYRKSTHLASVDVESIIAEKGKCVLKIKEAYYSKGVNVSGNKTDGYFLEFDGIDIKPMVVNSTNRKKIAGLVKNAKGVDDVASRNIGNWVGLEIELFVDKGVKMMGETVDGIRVKGLAIELPILDEKHAKFKAVKDSLKNGFTIEQVKTKYQVSEEIEKLLTND
jgi:hypothetical protein